MTLLANINDILLRIDGWILVMKYSMYSPHRGGLSPLLLYHFVNINDIPIHLIFLIIIGKKLT